MFRFPVVTHFFKKQYRRWFGSGGDGRNVPIIAWLFIEEHSCLIGMDVVWAKVDGYPFWPGQICLSSGIRLSQKISPVYNPELQRLCFFFGDESFSLVSKNNSPNESNFLSNRNANEYDVLPFHSVIKDLRGGKVSFFFYVSKQ